MHFTKHLIILGIIYFIAPSAYAASDRTTISINGYMRDNVCEVSAESLDINVDLKSHNAGDFYSGNYLAPAQPFSIILSPCGRQVSGIKVQFSGTSDETDTALLKLDSGIGMASGLAIQLLDKAQQPITTNAPFSTLSVIDLVPGVTNTLTYYARLKLTANPIRAGKVSAAATFTLEYQ